MSEAFEIAWTLLKSFQPSEGDFIGSGANQYVYGKDGDPNVTKVGSASTADEMYFNELLKPTGLFAGQKLIPQTLPFDMEIESRFGNSSPILSEQVRGIPYPDRESNAQHMADSRRNMMRMYDNPEYGALLEALGLADLKRPNYMRVNGSDKIHDPMFYGPASPPKSSPEYYSDYMARGTPRRFDLDYSIPDELKETFARRVDEMPFDEYVQPVFDSEVPMSSAQEGLLRDEIDNRGKRVNSILGQIGVKR